MAAKRNAGVDDCASLSGLSKLRRRRKKKSENDEPSGIAQPEDVAGEETFKDEASADVAKEETEEDKLRRERAGNIRNYFLLVRQGFSFVETLHIIASFFVQRNGPKRWKRWQRNAMLAKTMILLYLAFRNTLD